MKHRTARLLLAASAAALLHHAPLAAQSNTDPPPFLRTGPSLTQPPAACPDFVKTRWMDRDGDGWDDLWCYISRIIPDAKNPEKLADYKGRDTDGDGVRDYDEMLRWRDPQVKGPPLDWANLTPKEMAENARLELLRKEQAAIEQVRRIAEFKKIESPEKERGSHYSEITRTQEAESKSKMQTLQPIIAQKEAADTAAAQAILKRSNMPEKWVGQDGHLRVLDGMEGGRPVFAGSFNVNAADSISTDEIGVGGSFKLNLTGAGTTLGVWEIADPKTTHTEFLNAAGTTVRIVDKDGAVSASTQADRDHATHVSGTMIARGLDSDAKGMSPAAILHAYDQAGDLTEMSTIFSNSDPTDNLQLSNHSYGGHAGWDSSAYQAAPGIFIPIWWGDYDTNTVEDAFFGYYGSHAQTIDGIIYARKTYLPVWAAGNDRLQLNPVSYGNYFVTYRSLHPNGPGYYITQAAYPPADGNPSGYDTAFREGVSKNILTVGSIADLPGGFVTGSTVTVSSFSNAGPTDDGRIKPDVSANGESLYSSADSIDYGYLSGTSMAAPSATASVNLLAELFTKLHGASRVPWASTLKGLIIHTANDIGSAGPDYRGGFGPMNVKDAAAFLLQNVFNNSPLLQEVSVLNGQTIAITVKAMQGVAVPLRITIVWTDPAAAPSAMTVDSPTAKLINDVSLSVTKPDSTVELPWVLNSTSPANVATKAINSVDNVEQVVIQSPTPGATYTINISPASGETFVNENGQPAPQDVSVFISGAEPEPLKTQLASNGGGSYTVTWFGKAGAIYRVETSVDLIDWSEVSGDIAPTVTQTTSYTPTLTSGDRRFWRVKRIN